VCISAAACSYDCDPRPLLAGRAVAPLTKTARKPLHCNAAEDFYRDILNQVEHPHPGSMAVIRAFGKPGKRGSGAPASFPTFSGR
jgi:hypothetical protein